MFTSRRFLLLLLLIECAYAGFALARAPRWDAFLIGDCPYYAAACESLLRDGDWDLRNQLPGDLSDHNSFFALSHDQRVVPKHSVLMPIFSLPFRAVFGAAGLLIFSLVQIFVLIVGIAILAGDNPASRLLALVAYLSTPFLAYTFNYSPDVLATALLVWAFVFAIRNRPFACGLMAGLAVWAKIYLALVVLPIGIILLAAGWRILMKAGIAGMIALLPMLLINAHLFGSPFVTGYDRDARMTEAGFVLSEHYSRFHQPLLTGLRNLMFDGRIGMFRKAPLWILWPLGLLPRWRTRPSVAVAMTLSILANVIFFALYDEWDASEFGNRFLFPALALGFAMQGKLWEWARERWMSSRQVKLGT